MSTHISSTQDIADILQKVLSSDFRMKKHVKFDSFTADFVFSDSVQYGRTLAFSHKAIDTYDTYENIYVCKEDLHAGTFTKRMQEIYTGIRKTLQPDTKH